jgi:DNA-binding MarR family transcriptional regulator
MPTASPKGDHGLDERASSGGILLALLGQQAMRRLRAAHIEHGLSPKQFHLLGLLNDHGPLPQRRLGAALDVDPSVLVTILNPLEADGQITRERDPGDRRRHIVALTDGGRKALAESAKAQRRVEEEMFSGLDQGKREALRLLLVDLRDALERSGADCINIGPSLGNRADDP